MPKVNSKMFEVWRWWSERVRRGCQLRNLDEWYCGFDYTEPDETGWLLSVSTDALCTEYNRDHSENPMALVSFVPILRKVIVEGRTRERNVEMVVDGEKATKWRTFLIFKNRRWYEARLHSESYYVCFR